MSDSRSSQNQHTRRNALRVGAGVGALLLASGGLAGLGGCQSASQRRVQKRGGQIGQPIAADPVKRSSRPTPIPHHSSSAPTISAKGSLNSIPAFVIARTEWTKGKPRLWLADPMKTVRRITVHHDAISPAASGSYRNSVRRLTAIRNGHIGKGWADIGYHFAIDPSGRIWEARPLTLQGAHVKNRNPNNIGIVVFGNYEKIQPTSASLKSLDRLLAHEMERFRVPINQVFTHRELANTACPGRNLQQKMIQLRADDGRLARLSETILNHA